MGLGTYTQISRSMGVTIPALKKALERAGYLEGKVPTAKAEVEGMFEWRPLSAIDPGAGDFPLWDVDKVWEVAEAAGITGNAGNGVWSASSAGKQLSNAADLARGMKAKRSKDVEAAMGWCWFEAIEIIEARMYAGRRAAGALVRTRVAPLVGYLKENGKDSKARQALAKVEAVLAWFGAGKDD